jgi:hypothetical protein
MAEARNDKEGWKRGVGHYSNDYAKFTRPEDSKKVRQRVVNDDRDASLERPGPVSRGGPPRYKPKTGPLTNGAN